MSDSASADARAPKLTVASVYFEKKTGTVAIAHYCTETSILKYGQGPDSFENEYPVLIQLLTVNPPSRLLTPAFSSTESDNNGISLVDCVKRHNPRIRIKPVPPIHQLSQAKQILYTQTLLSEFNGEPRQYPIFVDSMLDTFATCAPTLKCIAMLLVYLADHNLGVVNNTNTNTTSSVVNLNLKQKIQIHHLMRLAVQGFMHVCPFTHRALSITHDTPHPSAFLSVQNQETHETKSVIAHFSEHAITNQGRKCIREWLLCPMSDRKNIETRLECIRVLIEQWTTNQRFQNQVQNIRETTLPGMKSLSSTATRLVAKRLQKNLNVTKDWQSLVQALLAAQQLAHETKQAMGLLNNEALTEILHPLFEANGLWKLAAILHSTIDMDASRQRGKCVIRKGIDDLLDASRQLYHNMDEILTQYAQEVWSRHPELVGHKLVPFLRIMYIPSIGYRVAVPICEKENGPREKETQFPSTHDSANAELSEHAHSENDSEDSIDFFFSNGPSQRLQETQTEIPGVTQITAVPQPQPEPQTCHRPDTHVAMQGRAIEAASNGWKYDTSTLDAHLFTNNVTREMLSSLGDTWNVIQDREFAIIGHIVGRIQPLLPLLHSFQKASGQLDALISIAKTSMERKYVQPAFFDSALDISGASSKSSKSSNLNDDNKSGVTILQGRHPLLETWSTENYVPNDVMLDQGHIALITGPNLSGKSVYLKMIGVLVWLAHCGFYVSAKKMTLTVYDNFVTRISSYDSISSDRSSFLIDLAQVNGMIRQASEKSFFLLDEFGKGTKAEQGMSLLAAVLARWLETDVHKAPTVCLTTHFANVVDILAKSLEAENSLENAGNPANPDACFSGRLQNIQMKAVIQPNVSYDELVSYSFKAIPGRETDSLGLVCAAKSGLPYETLLHAWEIRQKQRKFLKMTTPDKLEPWFAALRKSKHKQLLSILNAARAARDSTDQDLEDTLQRLATRILEL